MKWFYIEDKQPEILDKIIFWHKDNKEVQVGMAMPDGVHVNGYPYPCTHWMYLPEPPKMKKI